MVEVPGAGVNSENKTLIIIKIIIYLLSVDQQLLLKEIKLHMLILLYNLTNVFASLTSIQVEKRRYMYYKNIYQVKEI